MYWFWRLYDMRLATVDGFRGVFLFFMMVTHANSYFHSVLGEFRPHNFGWVEDAQGFIFLSGMVVTLAYGRIGERSGFAAMRGAILRRVLTIYAYQAALIAVALALGLLFADTPAGETYFQPIVERPVSYTIAQLLLVSGRPYMDILPMYIVFMLVTPWVIVLLNRGYVFSVLAVSVLVWGVAQTGLESAGLRLAFAWLSMDEPDWLFDGFFNFLGWQIVFFTGVLAGHLMLHGRTAPLIAWLSTPDARLLALLAFATFIGLGIFDVVVSQDLVSGRFSSYVRNVFDRADFSALHLLAAVVDLYLIVWLLNVGITATTRPVRAIARLLRWIVTRRPLVFLGQHSLQVYSAHVLVMFLVVLLFEGNAPGPVVREVLILLLPLPLFAAAWIHAKFKPPKIRPAPATAPAAGG